MGNADFRTIFERLTGYPPFPWQEALYDRFVSDRDDNIPASCNLPTGLGKTNVIAVWLIALTNRPDKMPRRLVYVVNRRTVVDQTTDEVEKLRTNLLKLEGWQPDVQELAISTLRGQFADNRQWSADPSRPAVICGTVDMIGSRLLFSGYGVGFKAKPLHAGFLGQDVLLVHDEAHLEPAFQHLIETIREEQKRCNEFGTFRVMELTATSRADGDAFSLGDDDKRHETVKERYEAEKSLALHELSDSSNLPDELVELAEKHEDSGCAVLIFARKVEDVEKIVEELPKESTEQLTGTMRGLERDGLVKKPIFQRFLAPSSRDKDVTPADGTVYLVCTSAGEVGVNISADHMVCDLSTFESMAQRFGRVNRFGERDDTQIDVVYPASFDNTKGEVNDLDQRRETTLKLLRQLNDNASPQALDELPQEARLAAFAPSPTILTATDILFDAWSLTTIRGKLPGRPPVEPYLHGISEWQPPETHVAWREEVGIITDDLLDDYPLKPHELLRDTSSRVFDRLKKLKADPTTPVWVVNDDGTVKPTTLGELLAARGKAKEIKGKTVLLPPKAGGLANGLLTSNAGFADDVPYDVADKWYDEHGNPRRCRIWDDDEPPDGMRLIRTIDTRPDIDAEDESSERRFWHWYESPLSGDGDGSKSSRKAVCWKVHTCDVTRNVERIVEPLRLTSEMKRAIVLAARFHDLGKRRTVFQTMLGNRDYPELVLAKSGKRGSRLAETYRHEFGSLVDVQQEAEFRQLDDDLQDLVLHLIAAHHGRGRPHFPADEAFDPEQPQAEWNRVACDVPRRFARLQRKYGRWGLAYLESLLRAADWAASANPSAFVEDQA